MLLKANIPKNIEVNCQIEDNAKLSSDPDILKRVVVNLVTNAVQAMPKGGKLAMKAKKDSDYVFGC